MSEARSNNSKPTSLILSISDYCTQNQVKNAIFQVVVKFSKQVFYFSIAFIPFWKDVFKHSSQRISFISYLIRHFKNGYQQSKPQLLYPRIPQLNGVFHVSMIGAGSMDGGMAFLLAENGISVSIQGHSTNTIDVLIKSAQSQGIHDKLSKHGL